MKIDVYSTMHNEILLLPYFLRHYETIADRIFVWEDESTDGTRELLSSHPKVTLVPLAVHGIDDVHWVRRVWSQYPKISRGKADWVIIVDADEFIYHPRLLDKLQSYLDSGTQVIKCRGYNMISDSFPTTTGQIYDEVKFGRYSNNIGKRCIFSPSIPIHFAPGRHFLKNRLPEDVIDNRLQEIMLLHYRYLGREYCAERSRRNLERMSAKNIHYNYHRSNEVGSRYGLTEWIEANRGEAIQVVA